jgi:hypothetical protein
MFISSNNNGDYMKMKIKELRPILAALVALGEEKIDFWYDVAKNTRRVKKAVTGADEIKSDLELKSFQCKNGRVKLFGMTKDDDGKMVEKEYSDDNRHLFTENTMLYKKFVDDEAEATFNEEVKKIENDEATVEFHVIPLSKFKKEEKFIELPSNPIAELLDTVITE